MVQNEGMYWKLFQNEGMYSVAMLAQAILAQAVLALASHTSVSRHARWVHRRATP